MLCCGRLQFLDFGDDRSPIVRSDDLFDLFDAWINNKLHDARSGHLATIGLLSAKFVIAGARRPIGRSIDEGLKFQYRCLRVLRPWLGLNQSETRTLLDDKAVRLLGTQHYGC